MGSGSSVFLVVTALSLVIASTGQQDGPTRMTEIQNSWSILMILLPTQS